jgi:hypothetical protein
MDCVFDANREVICMKIRTTDAGESPTSNKYRVVRAAIETNCVRLGLLGGVYMCK